MFVTFCSVWDGGKSYASTSHTRARILSYITRAPILDLKSVIVSPLAVPTMSLCYQLF